MARWRWVCVGLLLATAVCHAHAQRPRGRRSFGPPPGMQRENLVEKFDADDDGRLNDEERANALAYARQNPAGMPPFAVGGEPGEGAPRPTRQTTLDQDVAESQRRAIADDVPLYDTSALRTLFIQFAADDWYDELSDLYHTEVDVPAMLVVDGKTYPDVGVRFRGNSSYFMARQSLKKSWNISLNWEHKGQRLHGYRTLNLLNSHEDPSFVREVLFSEIGRDYGPAPKANHVRLVVNGEDWGVYVNVQQFNKDYTRDAFGTSGGSRWKVPANPKAGDGGLAYLGPDIDAYKDAYRLTSKDSDEAWEALVDLCDTLAHVPDDALEGALNPMFDIDGALWHLAMENVFVDHDGYMSRASDYNLYRDPNGRFHLVPHDSNETFRDGGRGGGPGSLGDAKQVDPFLHADSEERPVIRRLLGIPPLRARYAAHVRTIVDEWLNWERIGARVEAMHALIDPYVAVDDKQLYTYDDFLASLTEEFEPPGPAFGRPPGGAFGPLPGGRPDPPPGRGFGPLPGGLPGPPGGIPGAPGIPPIPGGPGVFPGVPSFGASEDASDVLPPPGVGGFEPDDRGRRGRRGAGRPTTPGLRPWVEARRAYLLGVDEIARPAPAAAEPTPVRTAAVGMPTTIAVMPFGDVVVTEAYLHYSAGPGTAFARAPMHSSGLRWKADLPAVHGASERAYYVELRGGGATAFVPARAEAGAWRYTVHMRTLIDGAVVINEFMAKNETSHADPQGDFDDWVELANTTNSPVDLTGHFLSDDPADPTKWMFPDGTSIEPRGYLVVWADDDDPDGGASAGVHAGFRLSSGSGSLLVVAPFDKVPLVLDRVDYGQQTADVSEGRSPDRAGEFVSMPPSPGGANTLY